MSEVKKSAKNIEYVEPVVLENKTRVISKAQLMKIPHDHPDTVDISLKIGRYNNFSKSVENLSPKSELTLNNTELTALIEYINKNYCPLQLGQGKYINVADTETNFIELFQNLIKNNTEWARVLLDNDFFNEHTLDIITYTKREQALKTYTSMLNEDYSEKTWQDWFSKNKWMFGSDFAEIIKTRSIDTDNISDYLTKAFDGYLDIVEIKKPNNMLFWSNTKDHGNYVPSLDLIKAITQCLNYIYAIERESNSNKLYEKTKCKIIKPRCTLVYGRSNNWDEEQKEAFRILNAAYNQVTILTYDHLFARYKNVYM